MSQNTLWRPAPALALGDHRREPSVKASKGGDDSDQGTWDDLIKGKAGGISMYKTHGRRERARIPSVLIVKHLQ